MSPSDAETHRLRRIPIPGHRVRRARLVREKYGALERFYLETDFSKGLLSNILCGRGSPSLATMVELAKALDVEVVEFFTSERTTKR